MTSQLKSIGIRAGYTAVLVATSFQVAHADPVTTTCDPINGGIASGVNCSQPAGTPTTLFSQGGIFSIIANTLIFLVGAISVIMLIIGGLRYVLSSGEASAVKGAKDTILYAIIGIIVAILAFAAVSFVIGRFTSTPVAQ